MISEDLRRSFTERARALEDSLRRLISEIMTRMPPDVARKHRQRTSNGVDVCFGAVDGAIHFDELVDDQFAAEIQEVRDLADLALETKAAIERNRRDAYRRTETLELKAEQLRQQQLRREIEAELP